MHACGVKSVESSLSGIEGVGRVSPECVVLLTAASNHAADLLWISCQGHVSHNVSPFLSTFYPAHAKRGQYVSHRVGADVKNRRQT